MTDEDIVMKIDKPHFVVKLHTDYLEMDLKEGMKKELESFVEAKPTLRESLGLLFQTIVPLDVRLRDISSVSLDEKGRVKVAIPSRKDFTIPLDADEAKRLIAKLDELIPLEKERALRDMAAAEKAAREEAARRAIGEKELEREAFTQK
jgi:hypothetical protein